MTFKVKRNKKSVVPFQRFKQDYYKTIKIGNKKFYVFKTKESIKGRKYRTAWLSVYETKDKKFFVVESGAGIPLERMNKQITGYLKKEK